MRESQFWWVSFSGVVLPARVEFEGGMVVDAYIVGEEHSYPAVYLIKRIDTPSDQEVKEGIAHGLYN